MTFKFLSFLLSNYTLHELHLPTAFLLPSIAIAPSTTHESLRHSPSTCRKSRNTQNICTLSPPSRQPLPLVRNTRVELFSLQAFAWLFYYYCWCVDYFSAFLCCFISHSHRHRKAAIKSNQFRNPKVTLKLFSCVAWGLTTHKRTHGNHKTLSFVSLWSLRFGFRNSYSLWHQSSLCDTSIKHTQTRARHLIFN